ncbi:MAG: HAD-IB family hydrolase [Candidatus Falkowbacteria bacterium]
MAIAIFDFDGTLITGQSQMMLIVYALKKRQIDIYSFIKIWFWFLAYSKKLAGNPQLIIAFAYRRLLHRKSEADILLFIEEFYHAVIAKKLRPKIISILEEHRLRGDEVILLTNALEPLARVVAKQLDCNRFFSTTPEKIKGVYTGEIEGEIMYGYKKAELIKKIFTPVELNNASAYCDHESDVALLELVGHPVAVGTNQRLIYMALKRHWQIIN